MTDSYVIRKLAFLYSDEFYYVHTVGGIYGIYQDKVKAQTQYRQLQIKAFRDLKYLDALDVLSPAVSVADCNIAELNEFYVANFGKTILNQAGDNWLHTERISIPEDASDEQILCIQKITGIKFYTLSEFIGELKFYGIWDTNEKSYLKYFDSAMYFYDSYDQANEYAQAWASMLYSDKVMTGSLPELSNQPDLLQSFVNCVDDIHYDSGKQELRIGYLEADQVLSLNALLKNPCYLIKEIPLEFAQACKHEDFEIG